MTKRFTYLNTTGWNKDAFLNTMNGLDEKNKKLQKENEQLKHRIAELQNELNNCEEDYIFEEYL